MIEDDERAGPSRSMRKRLAILKAAEEVFLREGYVGTSMDGIAAAAGVSKQTIYKHFSDKETLFRELITLIVRHTSDEAGTGTVIEPGRPADQELRAFARRLLHGVMQPRVLRLRRLVIGEATRFPAIGRAFHDLGLAATVERLAATFQALIESRYLQPADPLLAAEHFNWLVLATPLNRAMLLGDDHGIRSGDLDRYADAGVSAFLRAYATVRPPAGLAPPPSPASLDRGVMS